VQHTCSLLPPVANPGFDLEGWGGGRKSFKVLTWPSPAVEKWYGQIVSEDLF